MTRQARRRAITPACTSPGADLAEAEAPACAELGYLRWRFLRDAVDLDRLEPVAHTAFRAEIATTAVDLRAPPFDLDEAAWTHSANYGATQTFARVARKAEVGAIVYRSVRDPEPAWCVAALTPKAFARSKPDRQMQTWWLTVQRGLVLWRREGESLIFPAAEWER